MKWAELFALLTGIVVLAGVSIALTSKYTVGVVNAFTNGFANSIKAATLQG